MGHVSTIYGTIIGEAWRTDDYNKLHRLNHAIINSLPDNDEQFPWITKRMFMVPDPDKDQIYRDQVIVFGASYKSVEHEWDEWLEKFEAILKQLYWSTATIHLETELVGNHKYDWEFDMEQPDNWLSDNPQPTTMWTFSGGPRKFFDNYNRINYQ
ncbi:MAG: hypothetical protein V4613_03830 [Bacteroidota bacterium]